jgi:hypothetical protein
VLSVIKINQKEHGILRSQHAPRRMDQSDSIFSKPSASISEVRRKRCVKNGTTSRPQDEM